MTYIIAEPCVDVKDKACVEVCPVDCIYEVPDDGNTEHGGTPEEGRKSMLYIHPEECIDCGLCVDACPVEAIVPDDEVPDKWQSWIAKNYEAFDMEAP
ncbi:MAG: 4Fe-4S binding protein [Acidobacteria bacterium]|nr:4Fe-4S binding protein [Acidobacteriota bacterium]